MQLLKDIAPWIRFLQSQSLRFWKNVLSHCLKWSPSVSMVLLTLTAISAGSKNDYKLKWEKAVRAEMKPNAITFINAVKAGRHKWVEAEIKKGSNPNQLFYGDYTDAQSIIFPIEDAIRKGDIKMFDILAPVSNFDCALITLYEPQKGIDKDYMRSVLGSLLWEAYHRESSRKLLRHALEHYPRIRNGLDEAGYGMGLNVGKSPREKWTSSTEEACAPKNAGECAKYTAVMEIINEFPSQGTGQSVPGSDMSTTESEK